MFPIALALALTTPTTDVTAGAQDFALVNMSQHDVDELHLSPTTDDSWGKDILGVDILKNGDKTEVDFSGYTECNWDLKIVQSDTEGENGSEWIIPDVNLCDIVKMTLIWDGDSVAYTVKRVGE